MDILILLIRKELLIDIHHGPRARGFLGHFFFFRNMHL